METIKTTKIVGHTDDLDFGYWDDESETFVGLEKDPVAVQEHLGLSNEALSVITMFVADVRELVSTDLAEIWKRLDYIEEKAFE